MVVRGHYYNTKHSIFLECQRAVLGLTLQMIPLSTRSCLGVLEYPRAVEIKINNNLIWLHVERLIYIPAKCGHILRDADAKSMGVL